MRVFGLTGGMASGKSVVGARFASRGVPIVDADLVSREVALPGSEALALIAAAFGPGFILPDGALDRKKLSAAVFGDAAKVAKLNGIMLPRIAAASAKKVADLGASGEELVCYEAALLVENVDGRRVSWPLVVVSAPLEVQIARASARDGLSAEHVRARIAAQKALEEKERVADIVIRNDGSPVRAAARARRRRARRGACTRVGVAKRRAAVG